MLLTAAGSLLLAFRRFLTGFLGQDSLESMTVGDSGKLGSIKEVALGVSLRTTVLTSELPGVLLSLF